MMIKELGYVKVNKIEMLNKIIQRFGLEHPASIAFASVMDYLSQEKLEELFQMEMALPIDEDED